MGSKTVMTWIAACCEEYNRQALGTLQAKFVFALSHLDFEEFFEFAKVKSTRADHSYKLYCTLSRLNCFKYSFFDNVISHWNDLSRNVVEAGSLDLFKFYCLFVVLGEFYS